MILSALNTSLIVHQRKAKLLKESGLRSKASQERYLRLLLHFTGTDTSLVKFTLPIRPNRPTRPPQNCPNKNKVGFVTMKDWKRLR